MKHELDDVTVECELFGIRRENKVIDVVYHGVHCIVHDDPDLPGEDYFEVTFDSITIDLHLEDETGGRMEFGARDSARDVDQQLQWEGPQGLVDQFEWADDECHRRMVENVIDQLAQRGTVLKYPSGSFEVPEAGH